MRKKKKHIGETIIFIILHGTPGEAFVGKPLWGSLCGGAFVGEPLWGSLCGTFAMLNICYVALSRVSLSTLYLSFDPLPTVRPHRFLHRMYDNDDLSEDDPFDEDPFDGFMDGHGVEEDFVSRRWKTSCRMKFWLVMTASSGLGRLYMQQGRASEAEAFLKQGRELGDPEAACGDTSQS